MGQERPQPAGVLGIAAVARPPGLCLATQGLQDLTKGKKGVAAARVGAAPATGRDQPAMAFHRAPGKASQQGGLAAAGLAGDKNHLSLAGQCPAQESVEARHLLPAGDKGRQRWGTRVGQEDLVP